MRLRTAICTLTVLILTTLTCFAAEEFDTTNYYDMAIYLVECDTGNVVIDNNSNMRFAPVSITKTLTSTILLDYFESYEEIEVTARVLDTVRYGSSVAELEFGEILTVEQLIYAMLLPSGNDAARVVAVAVGRRILGDDNASVSAATDTFVEEMNRKAERIGMNNSRFANPDGFPQDGMYSTAQDLVKLGFYVLKQYPSLEQVAQTAQMSVVTNKTEHNWINSNMALHETNPYQEDAQNEFYDARIFGIKTGAGTAEDGRSYLFRAEHNGKEVVGVLMRVTADTGRNIFLVAHDVLDWYYGGDDIAEELPLEPPIAREIDKPVSGVIVGIEVVLSAVLLILIILWAIKKKYRLPQSNGNTELNDAFEKTKKDIEPSKEVIKPKESSDFEAKPAKFVSNTTNSNKKKRTSKSKKGKKGKSKKKKKK